MKLYQKSYFAFLLGVLTLSVYPIYMGFCVVAENIANGSVDVANFPKYIIPYTPISIAIIIGVCLIPLMYAPFPALFYFLSVIIFCMTSAEAAFDDSSRCA